MPKISQNKIDKAHSILKQYKVFTFKQVLKLLNCSIRTGRLKIKQWSVYNSYNQNGLYYAMPAVPEFDENGLWFYQNIYFSRHGNLKKTVVHLVETSPSGLTGRQIGDTVCLSPRSFMHHFRNVLGIKRKKVRGVYVYFSQKPEKYKLQSKRQSAYVTESISNVHAILILISVIRNYSITVDDIATLPEIKGAKISKRSIHKFMEKHGLLKKNPNTGH